MVSKCEARHGATSTCVALGQLLSSGAALAEVGGDIGGNWEHCSAAENGDLAHEEA